MKRTFMGLILGLLLAVCLVVPASAADYGVIYDETDQLRSDDLVLLGETILPQMAEEYGIDLRVDVLDSLGANPTVLDAAWFLYDAYDYGIGDGQNAITLTIYLTPDGDGWAPVTTGDTGDWYVLAAGASVEIADAGAVIAPRLTTGFDADRWSGGLEADQIALSQIVIVFAEAVADYAESGAVAGTIYDPATGRLDGGGTTAPGGEVPDDRTEPQDGEDEPWHIIDEAGLLSDGDLRALERQAQSIEEAYGCGVYVVTLQDYTEWYDGTLSDAIAELYHGFTLGAGPDRDGILLLLSMADRDYGLFVYGPAASYAFSEDGRAVLEGRFLSDFGADDWSAGFAHYLDGCEDFLAQAAAGEPIGPAKAPLGTCVLLGAVIGVAVALIVCLVLKARMKSVAKGSQADAYVTDRGLSLTGRSDQFSHVVTSRHKKAKESKGSSFTGGGGSGSTGKF